MDMTTFKHVKSLLKMLRKTTQKKDKTKKNLQVLKAFKKMCAALEEKDKDGKIRTRMRKYFALLWLDEWNHLVFRTYKRKGAYMFLKLIKDKPELLTDDEIISNSKLWVYIGNCAKWNIDSDDEAEEPEECTDSDTSDIENEDTPNIGKDGW